MKTKITEITEQINGKGNEKEKNGNLLINMKQTKMIMIHIQKLQARLLYSERRSASFLRWSWLESAVLFVLSMFCEGKFVKIK